MNSSWAKRAVAIVLAVEGLAVTAQADWPQYAGPDRNNCSGETGLLASWPAEGPKVLWTRPLGEGFGGAAIRDGQVFVLDRLTKTEPQKDVLRCLDLTSGKELWSCEYNAPGTSGYNGSRAVPAVTDKHVFSVGPFGQLLCVDRTTHQSVWQKNIVSPDAKLPPWAMAQCPLLYKDTVIVAAQNAGLTAYDQATGAVRWQAKGPTAPYVSPRLVHIGDQDQVVLTHGSGVLAVDAESGKTLWSFDGKWKCGIPIPNVTPLDGDRLFVTGGYKAGSTLLQVTGNQVKELWHIPQGSQIHQPVVIDGLIYFNGNTNETPKEGLTCIDPADGKLLWRSGANPRLDRCGFIFAEGLVYLQDASGTLNLVKLDRQGMKIVSSAKLLGGKDIWAPMALSDHKLVIRDQAQMKCLDLSATPANP